MDTWNIYKTIEYLAYSLCLLKHLNSVINRFENYEYSEPEHELISTYNPNWIWLSVLAGKSS